MPPPGAGEAPGPRNHRSTPPPPSPSAQPCGPGSCASESPRSGPVACFLLGSGRCFVDFCLRVGVPAPAGLRASGRASAPRSRAAGPRLPRSAVGLGARGARPEGGGREASGCVCLLPQLSPRSLREAGGFCGPPGAGGRGGRIGASRAFKLCWPAVFPPPHFPPAFGEALPIP